MISSGAFMRNWAMCKKVLAESHFFLKHGWIHFLGFLLIPRYNHDKIREEFKQRCRKIGILHFPCGGYFFVKYILCIMRYFCVHNTARTSAPHIEVNFIHDCKRCRCQTLWTALRPAGDILRRVGDPSQRIFQNRFIASLIDIFLFYKLNLLRT